MLSAVYAVVVCLSVCLCVSVTLRYCIKTDKRRKTYIMPHDRFGDSSFHVRCFIAAGFDKCLARSLCNSRASCYTIAECDRHTRRQTDGQIHEDGMSCA